MDDFNTWMSDVDNEIEARIGLSYRDLPDVDYRSMYDEGLDAYEAADEVISEL